MMDTRASNIINKVGSLTDQFGVQVTITRIIPNASPQMNIFGRPTNSTTEAISTKVIIESQKVDLMATLTGGKPTEVMKLIANTGIFQLGDEIAHGGQTFKVDFVEPVNFVAANVVDFVHAMREVAP